MPIVGKSMFEFTAEKVEDAKILKSFKKQHKGEWVVYDIHNGIVFSYYKTEEEAKKTAYLLNKTLEVEEKIQRCANKIISELTEEERKFLEEYTHGNIIIEI